MKLIYISLLAGSVALSSCGSLGTATQPSSTSNTNTADNLVEGLLNMLTETSMPIAAADLVGSWKYANADCRFESADMLKKAGGALVASQVETELVSTLTKVGIAPKSIAVSFTNDGSAQFVMGDRALPVAYTFNAAKKTVQFSDPLLGMLNMNADVAKNVNGNISLLFDGQKLLSLISMAGGYTNNATIQAASKLLSSYEGMKIGIELSR